MAKATSYWERDLSRLAPKTKREYEYHVEKFLKWADMTHEQLYEVHKASSEADDVRDSDEVTQLVKDYMQRMEVDGYSPATLNQFLKSLSSFFTSNKLVFSTKKLRQRPRYRGVNRISIEEIRQVYDEATGVGSTRDRNRALYMIAKDSGLRVSDLSALDVTDYLGARNVEVGGQPFKVFVPFETQKTGDISHMMIGSEAITTLDKMLNGRTEGPLFLNDEGQRWSPQAMTAHMLYVKRTVFKDESRISAHSYRKFHTTALEGAGLAKDWIKLLQGKAAYVYSRPQDGPELLEAYAGAYDSLRILPSQHLENEVKDLRLQVEALRENVATLTDYRDIGASATPTEELLRELREVLKADAEGASTEELERRVRELREKTEKEA